MRLLSFRGKSRIAFQVILSRCARPTTFSYKSRLSGGTRMVSATGFVRRILGFVFLAFGLNGFVHFIPQAHMPNHALEFFIGLAATGYMLPLLYITQAFAG